MRASSATSGERAGIDEHRRDKMACLAVAHLADLPPTLVHFIAAANGLTDDAVFGLEEGVG